ncbi:MAG TPA: DNA-3-methyladenine glycosylase 2 family protein [Candidatus Paceibacterota bacterium]
MLDSVAALKHFAAHDPRMAALLQNALTHDNPLTLPIPKQSQDYFGSIISSIVSQQISVHAARAIKGRVADLLGEITPETVIAADFNTLKACGLSEKKTLYIKQNAELWHSIPYTSFSTMTDEDIIAELTKLYGIGRWTAEMFLMFSLARPDVFSFGDLGLMHGLYREYQYKPHYTKKIKQTVETWSPHRTIASLTLWHSKDNPPPIQ